VQYSLTGEFFSMSITKCFKFYLMLTGIFITQDEVNNIYTLPLLNYNF